CISSLLLGLMVCEFGGVFIAKMIAHIEWSNRFKEDQVARQIFQDKHHSITNSVGMEFQEIPEGEYRTSHNDPNTSDENPYQITITKPFYIGIYEVTQSQYEALMGTNPSLFKGERIPVYNLTIKEIEQFIEKLNALPEEREAGRHYDLPTMAQWEYAARAGSTSDFCFGADPSKLEYYAWFRKNQNSSRRVRDLTKGRYVCSPFPVGQKEPNRWGLYDMHGNISELSRDCRVTDFMNSEIDPVGALHGNQILFLGGNASDTALGCRAVSRSLVDVSDGRFSDPLGFRLIMTKD
ncbi:MAG: formylglycine-generating enzyme family protein, partial [Pirellula sp.]